MTKNSYILRENEQDLLKLLENSEVHRDVILVMGARQVGKTTLVQHALQNKPFTWVDFLEDRSLVQEIDATKNFEEFTDLLILKKSFEPGKGKILVIDEAQESSLLGAYVHSMKEKWPHQTVILLGSLMHRLFREGTKYPVGRVQRFLVSPFSFLEFVSGIGENYLYEKLLNWSHEKPFHDTLHTKAMQVFATYLSVGGLPRVVLDFVQKKDWKDRIVELSFDYIEDYKRVAGEKDSNLFELCLKRVAQTLGSPSKLSTIMATSQPGYRRVADVLNLLENWLLVHKVVVETPQTTSGKIPPKRYLFDHGIRSRFSPLISQTVPFLQNQTGQNLSHIGGILENAVHNEILPKLKKPLISWREKTNGSEVDFVVPFTEKVLPLEVKAALKTNQKYFMSLLRCLEYFGQKEGALVNGDRGGVYEIQKKTIYQIPFYAIALFKDF